MNLLSFIDKLEQAGELIRIKETVSPYLEITEITDRFSKEIAGGKALLFEDNGSQYPILINSLGSEKRIQIAFGNRSPEELADEIQKLLEMITRGDFGFSANLRRLPILGKISRWLPKHKHRKGDSQEVICVNPDLLTLPVLTCWPFDGGPFLTLPLVHTVDPLSGSSNLGMYRMQVYGPSLTGMHWHMHKTGARHLNEYRRLGKRMPVAVALGGDPVYTYCATAPLPDGIDEYLLAGFIRNKPVTLVKCITQDIWVPEDCDFILEGYVDPNDSFRMEGPFGDHTGFYSLEDQFPIFHLTAITHKRHAIFPATIVGIPPQEDAWFAWATERIFKPMIKMAMVPELTDFHLPIEGVAHNIVLTKIVSSYPGQGIKVLHTLWGAGQMMFSKFLVITSGGPELTDYLALARHVSNRFDPSLHIEKAKGPLDILDHSSRVPAFGGKMGLDATGPEIFNTENEAVFIDEQVVIAFRSQNPQIVQMNLEWVQKGVSIGLLSLKKSYSGMVKDIEDEIRLFDAFSAIRFWIIFDDWVDLTDIRAVVWLTGSNVEVDTDVKVFPSSKGRLNGTLFVDATVKTFELDSFTRPWPNPTIMDQKTIQLVDLKWSKYNCGDFIESPSAKYLNYFQEGAVRKTAGSGKMGN
jgi:4-hydroxy-3-polyprenylbenzoate decarboxylase